MPRTMPIIITVWSNLVTVQAQVAGPTQRKVGERDQSAGMVRSRQCNPRDTLSRRKTPIDLPQGAV